MPKGLWLLLISGPVDLLSLGLSWGFLGLGSVVGLVPFVGGIGIPLGIALGDAVTVCLALMGLAALVIPMLMHKMFYWKYLFIDLGKLIPILNWIPFLSLFVIVCVARRYLDDKKEPGGIAERASQIASLAAAGSVTGPMLGAMQSIQAGKQRMQDIRPTPTYEKAAA